MVSDLVNSKNVAEMEITELSRPCEKGTYNKEGQ